MTDVLLFILFIEDTPGKCLLPVLPVSYFMFSLIRTQNQGLKGMIL